MSTEHVSEAEQLEQLKGHRLGPYMSFNPVTRTQVWQWCSAMGDRNPSYSREENPIAPPAMMQMWTMRDFNDDYAPGSTDAHPYKIFDDMSAMGYPSNVAVSYDITFLRYLAFGERVKHYTTVVNVSDHKTTGLGVGFFVTERVEYTTVEEKPFAEALITYFQYRASAQDETGSAVGKVLPLQDPEQPADNWQTDFQDVAASGLSVGDTLPELIIPITNKLVVAGAIATQDFIPVHHNVYKAVEAGMPYVFMNILTTSGLCARYLGDWAGQGSRLRHIKFNLMAPNMPGDTMTMEGEVAEIDGNEVAIKFGGRNSMGYHTRGSATVALAI